jgi:exosortase
MQATRLPLPAAPERGSNIRQWLGPAAVATLLSALYAGVVSDMARAWMNEMGASHGMLIPPLVALIVWTDRDRILARPVKPDNRGLALLIPAALLYIVGRLGAEFFLTRVSLMVYITALIWTFWGRARLSALKFPLLLLATMIPIPQLIYKTIAGPLQLFASTAATQLAQAAGITVFQDGNVIHLAGITLGVEEACSGMHSISALTVGALLLAFLQLEGGWLRVLLFLSSFPIAIAANVVRVTGTAILADHWQAIAMGFYHYFSGWAVFLAAFGLLVLVAAGLRRIEARFA